MMNIHSVQKFYRILDFPLLPEDDDPHQSELEDDEPQSPDEPEDPPLFPDLPEPEPLFPLLPEDDDPHQSELEDDEPRSVHPRIITTIIRVVASKVVSQVIRILK